MINQRITSEELKWVGLDWDNCLCDNSGMPDFTPTELLPGAKAAVERIIAKGFKPVVFTARPWSEFHLIKNKIKETGLQIKTIICGKPLMRTMIDDRAIGFRGDWKKAVDEIV